MFNSLSLPFTTLACALLLSNMAFACLFSLSFRTFACVWSLFCMAFVYSSLSSWSAVSSPFISFCAARSKSSNSLIRPASFVCCSSDVARKLFNSSCNSCACSWLFFNNDFVNFNFLSALFNSSSLPLTTFACAFSLFWSTVTCSFSFFCNALLCPSFCSWIALACCWSFFSSALACASRVLFNSDFDFFIFCSNSRSSLSLPSTTVACALSLSSIAFACPSFSSWKVWAWFSFISLTALAWPCSNSNMAVSSAFVALFATTSCSSSSLIRAASSFCCCSEAVRRASNSFCTSCACSWIKYIFFSVFSMSWSLPSTTFWCSVVCFSICCFNFNNSSFNSSIRCWSSLACFSEEARKRSVSSCNFCFALTTLSYFSLNASISLSKPLNANFVSFNSFLNLFNSSSVSEGTSFLALDNNTSCSSVTWPNRMACPSSFSCIIWTWCFSFSSNAFSASRSWSSNSLIRNSSSLIFSSFSPSNFLSSASFSWESASCCSNSLIRPNPCTTKILTCFNSTCNAKMFCSNTTIRPWSLSCWSFELARKRSSSSCNSCAWSWLSFKAVLEILARVSWLLNAFSVSSGISFLALDSNTACSSFAWPNCRAWLFSLSFIAWRWSSFRAFMAFCAANSCSSNSSIRAASFVCICSMDKRKSSKVSCNAWAFFWFSANNTFVPSNFFLNFFNSSSLSWIVLAWASSFSCISLACMASKLSTSFWCLSSLSCIAAACASSWSLTALACAVSIALFSSCNFFKASAVFNESCSKSVACCINVWCVDSNTRWTFCNFSNSMAKSLSLCWISFKLSTTASFDWVIWSSSSCNPVHSKVCTFNVLLSCSLSTCISSFCSLTCSPNPWHLDSVVVNVILVWFNNASNFATLSIKINICL